MFDTERFITEIHARECIWNLASTSYHDRNMKRDAWIEIFNLTSDKIKFHEMRPVEKNQKIADLQRKWKNIRDHFKKCSKLVSRTGSKSGIGLKNPKPYIHAEILSFLVPIMQNTRKKPQVEDDGESSIIRLDDEERSNDDTRIQIRPEKRHKRHSETPVVVPRQKISKQSQNEEKEEPKLERVSATQDNKEDDADKFFLLSLLPQIRELNIDQKNFLYIEFLQSIRRAKLYQQPYPLNFQTNSQNNFETYSTQNTSSSPHTECSVDNMPSPQYSETKDEVYFKIE